MVYFRLDAVIRGMRSARIVAVTILQEVTRVLFDWDVTIARTGNTLLIQNRSGGRFVLLEERCAL